MSVPLRVLFVCDDNRALGPMAEGWARGLRANRFEAVAAGLTAGARDAFAVRVMAESGVDIHRLPVRTLAEMAGRSFDLVVALTASAADGLPPLPGDPRVLRLGLTPPSAAAAAPLGSAVSRASRASAPARPDAARLLAHYRRLRDEIRDFVETLPGGLVPVNSKYYWVQPEFLQPAATRG